VSDKKRIFAGLTRLSLGASHIDFRSTLAHLARTELGLQQLDADRFADTNIRKYWNWFLQEVDEHRRRGLSPFYSSLIPNTFAFSCACHELTNSSDPLEKNQGKLSSARPFLLRQIDALTDRQYEALACVSCQAIGATNCVLTPPGNEGGIDFIATLRVSTKTHIFSALGSEVRLIGQCKKYITPASVDRVEQFLHTMQNVRHRSDRVKNHIPPWFNDAKGPIVGWVISHSGFQTGAKDEAKKHGIVLSDSLDIAELLGLSDTFAANLAPSDRPQHLLSECQRLLS